MRALRTLIRHGQRQTREQGGTVPSKDRGRRGLEGPLGATARGS